MRKYFEGHSFIGLALILSVFAFALLLRFYNLESQSPWSDELASWWYTRHLDAVWGRESHSPLYYALLRIFVGTEGDITPIRTFSAVVSTIHLIEFFFLGQMVFDKKRFLLFWILVCLNPADIIYARMGRHYGWLLEGVLVFYLLMKTRAPNWLLSLVAAFMGFIHVFAVIPCSFLILYRYWRNKNKTSLYIALASANVVVGYYFLRILFLGHDKVRSNVSWNEFGFLSFGETLITQFLGDSFPRIMAYPVNFTLAAGVVGVTSIFIAYKRKESGVLFLGLFIASILITESLSFWINLRVNRYFIYLVGFWIVALVDSFDDVKDATVFVTLILAGFYIQYMNPFLTYPWDDEKVAQWRTFVATNPVKQQLVCANPYQSDYYKLGAHENCLDAVGSINAKEPLLYFDLGALFVPVTTYLSSEMKVEEFVPMKNGLMVKFVPRKVNEK